MLNMLSRSIVAHEKQYHTLCPTAYLNSIEADLHDPLTLLCLDELLYPPAAGAAHRCHWTPTRFNFTLEDHNTLSPWPTHIRTHIDPVDGQPVMFVETVDALDASNDLLQSILKF